MVLSLKTMLGVLVLKKYAECTSRRVKRTSGAQVVKTELELSLTNLWRTWAIFGRRVTNLSYLWPTCDELELSLTDVWRTWAIFGPWVSDFHEVRLDVPKFQNYLGSSRFEQLSHIRFIWEVRRSTSKNTMYLFLACPVFEPDFSGIRIELFHCFGE